MGDGPHSSSVTSVASVRSSATTRCTSSWSYQAAEHTQIAFHGCVTADERAGWPDAQSALHQHIVTHTHVIAHRQTSGLQVAAGQRGRFQTLRRAIRRPGAAQRADLGEMGQLMRGEVAGLLAQRHYAELLMPCLLYTSDAADDLLCVDLGGRRIIKPKQHSHTLTL